MHKCVLLVFCLISGVSSHAAAQGLSDCGFGFDIDTQSSAFQSMIVDGEKKRGFWLSINRAPADVQSLAKYVGRLQVCLMTPDGKPRSIKRGGSTVELKSPFVANCTAALLPNNRLLTNSHCFYDPDLARAGFSIVREARIDFNYTSRDDTGAVRTYLVSSRELNVDKDLDALVLQVLGGDANADLGGHIPMKMMSETSPLQALWMIHHPGADPQQFSSGTCQVHPRQTEIPDARSPFRHTCESTGGSSGSLLFDSRTLAIVALHNQGGLSPTGNSFNGGHKIGMIEAALNLGFEEYAQPEDGSDAARQLAAVQALSEALLAADPREQMDALREVIRKFEGSNSAQKAQSAITRLEAHFATQERNVMARSRLNSAEAKGDINAMQALLEEFEGTPFGSQVQLALLQARAASPSSLIENEPKDRDLIRQCDVLTANASNDDNPFDVKPVAFDEIDGSLAIPVCKTALQAFPDELRVMYQLGRAISSVGENETEAVRWYTKAAEQGYAKAQSIVAYNFRWGDDGVAKDSAEAVRWYTKAAKQELSEAQYNLAVMYDNGEGVEENDAVAVRWFRAAATQGHARAQNHLGTMYDNGNGVAEDNAEAVYWYGEAAEQGNASAQTNLGLKYETGDGVEEDHVEAVRWYTKAADQGLPRGQYLLAQMNYFGRGNLTGGYAEAAVLFRSAADQGYAKAQQSLGFMYRFGYGGKTDHEEAAKLFRQAAEQGLALAQYRLAKMYDDGLGVEEDDAEAVRWHRLAAEQGNSDAQNSLGYMYNNGKGVEKDGAKAVSFYRSAAIQGHKTAQRNLGELYERGLGVEQDSFEAAFWLRKAANQGQKTAVKLLQELFDDVQKATALQRRLREEGFYDGELDGVFGSGSKAALDAYIRATDS